MMILKSCREICGLVIILLLIILCRFLSPAIGETKTLCQCQIAMIPCDATQVLQWNGTAFMNQCAEESITHNIDNLANNNTYESSCGCFTVTSTKEWKSDPTRPGMNIYFINSTLSFEAVDDLMGHTIMCTVDGDMQPENIMLNVTSCDGTTGACKMRQCHDEATTYATTSTVTSITTTNTASTSAMHLSLLLLGALFYLQLMLLNM